MVIKMTLHSSHLTLPTRPDDQMRPELDDACDDDVETLPQWLLGALTD